MSDVEAARTDGLIHHDLLSGWFGADKENFAAIINNLLQGFVSGVDVCHCAVVDDPYSGKDPAGWGSHI
ncbi:MAG: hypothetical protein BWY69_01499 [Planctomycetes bacterium ADurb.Bin401]|nr:MAG: hypothetical protein BWY69_01499 [Planctomycetes bacterium ADurb.Bin401]